MENKIYCKNCKKQIRTAKGTGFNPVFQGKVYKDKETGMLFSICYDCLRRIKKELKTVNNKSI